MSAPVHWPPTTELPNRQADGTVAKAAVVDEVLADEMVNEVDAILEEAYDETVAEKLFLDVGGRKMDYQVVANILRRPKQDFHSVYLGSTEIRQIVYTTQGNSNLMQLRKKESTTPALYPRHPIPHASWPFSVSFPLPPPLAEPCALQRYF
jgi:hypothetical protein